MKMWWRSPRLRKGAKMAKDNWLPSLIQTDKDKELVRLVCSSLNNDTPMIRAFVVALLEANNDHEVARDINDILKKIGWDLE